MSTTLTFVLSPRALDLFHSFAKTADGGDARVGYGDAQRVELAVSRGKAKLLFFRRKATWGVGEQGGEREYLRTETVHLLGRATTLPGKPVSEADGVHVVLVNRGLRTWGLVGKALYPRLRREGSDAGVATLVLRVYLDGDDRVTVYWGVGDDTGVPGRAEGYELPGGAYDDRGREPFRQDERSRFEVWGEDPRVGDQPSVLLEHESERPVVTAVYDWGGGPEPAAPAEAPAACGVKNASNMEPCAVEAVWYSPDSGRSYCSGHAPWFSPSRDRLVPIPPGRPAGGR